MFIAYYHDGPASSCDVRQFAPWQSTLEKACFFFFFCVVHWEEVGISVSRAQVHWYWALMCAERNLGQHQCRKSLPQTSVSACLSFQIPTSLVSSKVWGKQTLDADLCPLGQIKFATGLEFVLIDLRARWYRHEHFKVLS